MPCERVMMCWMPLHMCCVLCLFDKHCCTRCNEELFLLLSILRLHPQYTYLCVGVSQADCLHADAMMPPLATAWAWMRSGSDIQPTDMVTGSTFDTADPPGPGKQPVDNLLLSTAQGHLLCLPVAVSAQDEGCSDTMAHLRLLPHQMLYDAKLGASALAAFPGGRVLFAQECGDVLLLVPSSVIHSTSESNINVGEQDMRFAHYPDPATAGCSYAVPSQPQPRGDSAADVTHQYPEGSHVEATQQHALPATTPLLCTSEGVACVCGQQYEVKAQMEQLGPVVSCIVEDLLGEGVPQIYVARAEPRGGIAVVSATAEVHTLHSSAPGLFDGVIGLWVLQPPASDAGQGVVVLSFATGSRAMSAGPCFEDVSDLIGLQSGEATLACGVVGHNVIAQVTRTGVQLCYLDALVQHADSFSGRPWRNSPKSSRQAGRAMDLDRGEGQTADAMIPMALGQPHMPTAGAAKHTAKQTWADRLNPAGIDLHVSPMANTASHDLLNIDSWSMHSTAPQAATGVAAAPNQSESGMHVGAADSIEVSSSGRPPLEATTSAWNSLASVSCANSAAQWVGSHWQVSQSRQCKDLQQSPSAGSIGQQQQQQLEQRQIGVTLAAVGKELIVVALSQPGKLVMLRTICHAHSNSSTWDGNSEVSVSQVQGRKRYRCTWQLQEAGSIKVDGQLSCLHICEASIDSSASSCDSTNCWLLVGKYDGSIEVLLLQPATGKTVLSSMLSFSVLHPQWGPQHHNATPQQLSTEQAIAAQPAPAATALAPHCILALAPIASSGAAPTAAAGSHRHSQAPGHLVFAVSYRDGSIAVYDWLEPVEQLQALPQGMILQQTSTVEVLSHFHAGQVPADMVPLPTNSQEASCSQPSFMAVGEHAILLELTAGSRQLERKQLSATGVVRAASLRLPSASIAALSKTTASPLQPESPVLLCAHQDGSLRVISVVSRPDMRMTSFASEVSVQQMVVHSGSHKLVAIGDYRTHHSTTDKLQSGLFCYDPASGSKLCQYDFTHDEHPTCICSWDIGADSFSSAGAAADPATQGVAHGPGCNHEAVAAGAVVLTPSGVAEWCRACDAKRLFQLPGLFKKGRQTSDTPASSAQQCPQSHPCISDAVVTLGPLVVVGTQQQGVAGCGGSLYVLQLVSTHWPAYDAATTGSVAAAEHAREPGWYLQLLTRLIMPEGAAVSAVCSFQEDKLLAAVGGFLAVYRAHHGALHKLVHVSCRSPIISLSVDVAGHTIAAADMWQGVVLYEFTNGEESPLQLKYADGCVRSVLALTLSPDGKSCVCVDARGHFLQLCPPGHQKGPISNLQTNVDADMTELALAVYKAQGSIAGAHSAPAGPVNQSQQEHAANTNSIVQCFAVYVATLLGSVHRFIQLDRMDAQLFKALNTAMRQHPLLQVCSARQPDANMVSGCMLQQFSQLPSAVQVEVLQQVCLDDVMTSPHANISRSSKCSLLRLLLTRIEQYTMAQ